MERITCPWVKTLTVDTMIGLRRKIKFRARTIRTKTWQVGSFDDYGVKKYIIQRDGRYRKIHLVDGNTVGEFTGVYDSTKWKELSRDEKKGYIADDINEKNWTGKEIYEDDIVEYGSDFKNIRGKGVVAFKDGRFIIKEENESLGFFSYIKIIGNIHDNPNLI